MKRKLTAAVLTAALAMISAAAVHAADIHIVIDGSVVESDVSPQITAEGRTLVPLRVISETLGAKVDWDGETKTVTAEKDGKTLSLTIGAKVMDNDGAKLTLDSPAQIVDGRTMVPLRVISESFGCKVDWDGASKTVKVTSGASADNKSEKKETVTLPAYSYKGDDPYTEAVCKKIINDHLYFFDKASVSVPVPAIVDIDDKNQNDVKVWGLFWLLNYDLNGTVLETASGGSFPGCIHLKKTDSGYVATRFDKAEDGSDYSDSLRKICENNETRIKKFSEKSDKLNEEIKATLEAYVKENGLDITAYQDYGWDPVMLDVKEESAAFGDEVPELFEFSSGAGGWSTELKLKKDGSFKGGFHDSEMGSTGEGYPNGTMYICEFDGKFTDIKKNEDGSYSMTLGEVKTVKEQDEEWIDKGVKYISSFPYGLEEGKDFVLYTPDTLTKDLSEEFLTWWPGRFDEKADKTKLGCWGIYNKTTEYGFFAYEE